MQLRAIVIVAVIAAACTGCIPAPGGSRATATVTITKTTVYTPPNSAPVGSGGNSSSTPVETIPPTASGPATSITADGTYVVGVDIAPGVYRSAGTSEPGMDCYWKRLSSLNTSDIIDNEGSEGPQVVEIMASDKAFSTDTCKPWVKAGR